MRRAREQQNDHVINDSKNNREKSRIKNSPARLRYGSEEKKNGIYE
jgi:hypothetical protein